MPISFSEVTTRLLSGSRLSWSASGSVRAGSITLVESRQRRLLNYLLEADPSAVADGAEELIDGMISEWLNDDSDPIPSTPETSPSSDNGPWRLQRIETTNFGGLNTYGGPAFVLEVASQNWCLEGSNGSGKTMIASAIVWALTGYRLREHNGLDLDGGKRAPVYNKSGKLIGNWPPIITYPKSTADLTKTATVEVILTFVDPDGNSAIARRTLVSPPGGDTKMTSDLDERLTAAPELIETGILMPARLAHIGFGAKSTSLYEAMKMLTGLDHLSAVALGASAFCNRGRKFLKYAKDQRISHYESKFSQAIERARSLTEESGLNISTNLNLEAENLIEVIQSLCQTASDQAAGFLTLLKSEISDNIDLENVTDRHRLARAVNSARDVVDKKSEGIPLFAAWAALTKSNTEKSLDGVCRNLDNLESKLQEAIVWNAKQSNDEKLRLKALASRFYVPHDDLSISNKCPLCLQSLTTKEQLELAEELRTLKADSEYAERKLEDACRDIRSELDRSLPNSIKQNFEVLRSMSPVDDYGLMVRKRFASSPPFSDVLIGVSRFVNDQLSLQLHSLPSFDYADFHSPTDSELPPITETRRHIYDVRRIAALADWWEDYREQVRDAWRRILGARGADGLWPQDSLEGMLSRLESAISKVRPLDSIADYLRDAKDAAKERTRIANEQRRREAIAKDLESLKDLSNLVNSETHRSIQSLSGRVQRILSEIRLKDRFDFDDTQLMRRQVEVHGRFSDDYKIDASLVANASWLRSILWALVFAMREEAIADQSTCIFPLMVLDDPQLTFDPKNKRKWAEKLVNDANSDGAGSDSVQLLLFTHERQFFDIITGSFEFRCENGIIARPHGESGIVQILNGSRLDRGFSDAQAEQSDEKGYNYVQDVRVYCEDLLRIMLRPESYELTENTLGSLKGLLVRYSQQHVPPFDRPIFKKLVSALDANTNSPVNFMNATSHTNDGTVGLAQAEDVHCFWNNTLKRRFEDAFMLAADYDAYAGDPRLYDYPEPTIVFPSTRSEVLSRVNLLKTGIATAAATDGLVGDGSISIEEWDSVDSVRFHNHSAYGVCASTLEPIATIGDVLVVKNYGTPNSSNLVVAVHGDELVARRLNLPVDHPGMAVLTGQSTNPYTLPEPIIAPVDKLHMRKIIGTLFSSYSAQIPAITGDVSPLEDGLKIADSIDGTHLFRVSGRSMEPIALDNQFVITRREDIEETTLRRLNGRLVIAIDESGARYFKRLRRRSNLIVLESANSDTTTDSEVLSLGGADYPMLVNLLSVNGVLFEEP